MAVADRHEMFAHPAHRFGAGRIHQIGEIGQRGTTYFDILITAAALSRSGQHFQKAAGVTV
jgi:hypothetical protein